MSDSGRLVPYQGQDLSPRPHVLVIYCDQAGAFLVATPLMRGLRERYPSIILDYLGGEGVRELEEASRLVDARYSLFGREDGPELLPAFFEERFRAAGPYDLVVNLESDPLAADASALSGARYAVRATPDQQRPWLNPPAEGIDRLTYDTWNRRNLLDDYPELQSQFIGEIYCRLTRVDTDFARTEAPAHEPGIPTPGVFFAAGGRRSRKLWPHQHWLELAAWARRSGIEVGLLGAAPARQASDYHSGEIDQALIQAGLIDLRSPALTLPQVAGALARARVLVTIDSALMHLAAAVRAPTIALFGASPQRIWAPPVPWVALLEPSDPCSLCEDNRFKNDDCLLPVHQCMISIAPSRVIAALERTLNRPGN